MILARVVHHHAHWAVPRTEDAIAQKQMQVCPIVGAYLYGKCNGGVSSLRRPLSLDDATPLNLQGHTRRGRPTSENLARTANAPPHTADHRGLCRRMMQTRRSKEQTPQGVVPLTLHNHRQHPGGATAVNGIACPPYPMSVTNGRSLTSATQPGCSMRLPISGATCSAASDPSLPTVAVSQRKGS